MATWQTANNVSMSKTQNANIPNISKRKIESAKMTPMGKYGNAKNTKALNADISKMPSCQNQQIVKMLKIASVKNVEMQQNI